MTLPYTLTAAGNGSWHIQLTLNVVVEESGVVETYVKVVVGRCRSGWHTVYANKVQVKLSYLRLLVLLLTIVLLLGRVLQ
jgi:hypothetical protein